MATVVLGRPRGGWTRAGPGVRGRGTVALLGLLGISLALRVGDVGAHLWMDEGIAAGIAGHPLAQIPGLLRLDGSPPLYYVLLHGWMAIAGTSDAAVHWLSVGFALLCVPAGLWCGRAVGDRRTGWILAVLAACSPFLTRYATEARMYSLVALLGLLCLGCFARAFVHRRRAYRVPFGVTLALSLYAHNWALFLAVAFAAAVVRILWTAPRAHRGEIGRDALIGFGVAAALYAPWLPTLLYQAAHTGDPWAIAPARSALVISSEQLLGGLAATILLTGIGVTALRARRGGPPAAMTPSLWILALVPPGLAWGLSQLSPAWDTRYLAVILAPALALAARGLTSLGRIGIAALLVLVALWAPARMARDQSDAFQLARASAPLMHRGDLVIATPFAQIPLLAHYLPPGLRYATTLGPDRDPRVVDWRDVTRRLAHASVRDLQPLLARARPGSDVLLVLPVEWDERSRHTALGRQERLRSRELRTALLHDRRFRLIAALPLPVPQLPGPSLLRGLLLRRS